MSFIFFIIVLILLFGAIILFSVIGFIRSIFVTLFGFARKKNRYSTSSEQASYNDHSSSKTKVFEPSEGEYIDFEEVKE